jgi:hypothetical protein
MYAIKSGASFDKGVNYLKLYGLASLQALMVSKYEKVLSVLALDTVFINLHEMLSSRKL